MIRPLMHTLYQDYRRQFPTGRNGGVSKNLNNRSLSEISLAPELEYNFLVNFGVIMGDWFSVVGRNTPSFVTPFNGFW